MNVTEYVDNRVEIDGLKIMKTGEGYEMDGHRTKFKVRFNDADIIQALSPSSVQGPFICHSEEARDLFKSSVKSV